MESGELQVLLGLIEADQFESDSFYQEIETAALEECKDTLNCSDCSKVFKTASGLKRHINSKHKDLVPTGSVDLNKNTQFFIQSTQFRDLLTNARHKLSTDDCFCNEDRDCFINMVVTESEYLQVESFFLKEMHEFKGNAEKFYSSLHHKYTTESVAIKEIPKELYYLLLAELTTLCLNFLITKESKLIGEDSNLEINLSEKDIRCLEYIAGYVFQKLYSKLRNKKMNDGAISAQWLDIILSSKTQDEQKLVDSRDRGGLWKMNKLVINIFSECEKKFRIHTRINFRKIDSKVLVSQLLNNCFVKSCFYQICDLHEAEVDKEIAKTLLYHIVMLFIRVRSHSHTKQIKEKFKNKKKITKAESLRSSLKKPNKIKKNICDS
jgi:hypothetical protein